MPKSLLVLLGLKAGTLLVLLAVVLGVLGAGLSYTGYNASLRVVTVTNIQSYATNVISSTRTGTIVVTTASTLSILDNVIEIPSNVQGATGCLYAAQALTLDAGKIDVSYHTDGGAVDFWMLTEGQWAEFQDRMQSTCEYGQSSRVFKPHSASYDFTTDVPTSATYYFAFVNKNVGSVMVWLHVDGSIRTTVLTKTEEHVDYLTQTSTLMIKTVSASSQLVGPGLLLYSGIGLIIVAGIASALSRRRVAAALSVIVSVPVLRSHKRSIDTSSKAKTQHTRYIEYVAKLEELKSRGEISEDTYLKLKDEYWKKIRQGGQRRTRKSQT